MERTRSHRRQRRHFEKPLHERIKTYMRNFIAFMFSNVGIILLVVGYTVSGAFIFRTIEGEYSKQRSYNVMLLRNHTSFKLWNYTYHMNVYGDEVRWRNIVDHEMLNYQHDIVQAIRIGYDGSNHAKEPKQWSFSAAFLYSLTVITTIGYGNVSPRTEWGKLTTICYAIIGMPLFLLYLSNIGDILARSFKWIYAKCCLCRWCPSVAERRRQRQRRRKFNAMNVDAQYYCRQSAESDTTDSSETASTSYNSNLSEKSDEDFVTVPLTICLTIIVGYVCGGAILFSKYEDWGFLDSSYFCFISLSTIGFGDFVPGDKIYNDAHDGIELSFIFCSMYLYLGMALIAMCFNLMQEEVIHKIRTVMRVIHHICHWRE